jgi:hypothetical protein
MTRMRAWGLGLLLFAVGVLAIAAAPAGRAWAEMPGGPEGSPPASDSGDPFGYPSFDNPSAPEQPAPWIAPDGSWPAFDTGPESASVPAAW